MPSTGPFVLKVAQLGAQGMVEMLHREEPGPG